MEGARIPVRPTQPKGTFVVPNLPGMRSNRTVPRNKVSGFRFSSGGVRIAKEDLGSDLSVCLSHRDTGSTPWVTTGGTIGSKSSREDRQAAGVQQVLRFFAYYKENVTESNAEKERTRKVEILYYPADQTVEIREPKSLNSGIPQGCFLTRGAHPDIDVGQFCIGYTTKIYGRAFKIYDADDETFRACQNIGERDHNLINAVKDNYTDQRQTIARLCGGDGDLNYGKQNSALKFFMEASLGNSMQRGSNTLSEKKSKFLDNSRKVLSFACEFDDRQNLYGDLMNYTLNYYLEDDTVEVKETRQANSGRDAFPLLLSRQKLPHNWMEEGINDKDRGVEADNGSDVYITPDDIQIGDHITVYGKQLKVVDCDDFTRKWYKANPQMLPQGWSAQPAGCRYLPPVVEAPLSLPPPHNGYGTEEDSLGSTMRLVPKVPKKDFQKFLDYSTTTLRFKAKFVEGTCSPEHSDREFIISYYPADDTQAIFEDGQRNSGIVPGKFLQRGKYKIQDSSRYYNTEDFYVGAEVGFNSHRFKIFDLDKCTENLGYGQRDE